MLSLLCQVYRQTTVGGVNYLSLPIVAERYTQTDVRGIFAASKFGDLKDPFFQIT